MGGVNGVGDMSGPRISWLCTTSCESFAATQRYMYLNWTGPGDIRQRYTQPLKPVRDDFDEAMHAWATQLENELQILLRSCNQLRLWNSLCDERFRGWVAVFYFRYNGKVGEPQQPTHDLQFVWEGGEDLTNPAQYRVSNPLVELLHLDTRAQMLPVQRRDVELAVLTAEALAIAAEAESLHAARVDARELMPPHGVAYRQLVRDAAQRGMTRYALRPSSKRQAV